MIQRHARAVRASRGRLRSTWSLALAVLTAAGCSGGGGAAPSRSAAPTATVETARVTRGAIREELTTLGTVIFDPHEIDTVTFERSGMVQKMLVSGGQAVASGTDLVVVGPLPEGTPQVQRARIELRFAQSNLARLRRQLAEELATNDQVQQAQREVSSAQASLKALGVGLEPTTLQAPFAGVVSDVQTTSGAFVKAGDAAVSIAPANGVVVRVGFEIEDASRLSTGLEASIEPVFPLGDQSPTAGKLTQLQHEVDAATQLVEGRVTPSGNPPWMLAGTRVRVSVVVESSPKALKVPMGAVLRHQGKRGVFAVEGGKAHWTPIEIGIENGDEGELLSGLQEGAKVVTTGRTSLQDGMKVEVAGEAP